MPPSQGGRRWAFRGRNQGVTIRSTRLQITLGSLCMPKAAHAKHTHQSLCTPPCHRHSRPKVVWNSAGWPWLHRVRHRQTGRNMCQEPELRTGQTFNILKDCWLLTGPRAVWTCWRRPGIVLPPVGEAMLHRHCLGPPPRRSSPVGSMPDAPGHLWSWSMGARGITGSVTERDPAAPASHD